MTLFQEMHFGGKDEFADMFRIVKGGREELSSDLSKNFLCAMTTGYTFSIVEKNSMERLYGILPIRKSNLIIAKIPIGESALLLAVMNSPALLILLTIAFVFAMYIISVLISVKILQNKEM